MKNEKKSLEFKSSFSFAEITVAKFTFLRPYSEHKMLQSNILVFLRHNASIFNYFLFFKSILRLLIDFLVATSLRLKVISFRRYKTFSRNYVIIFLFTIFYYNISIKQLQKYENQKTLRL